MTVTPVQIFMESDRGKHIIPRISAMKTGSDCVDIEKSVINDFPMYDFSKEEVLMGYIKMGNYILITDKNVYLNMVPSTSIFGAGKKPITTQLPVDDIKYFKMDHVHFGEFLDIHYKGTFLGRMSDTTLKASPYKLFVELFAFCRNPTGKDSSQLPSTNTPTPMPDVKPPCGSGVPDKPTPPPPIPKSSPSIGDMIQTYLLKGFVLDHSNDTIAQLSKKKSFSWVFFILWVMFGVFPGIFYLIYYRFMKKDEMVTIRVVDGEINITEE
ncbi:MAG: hypothetical protein KAS32_29510 [Candidatus Peribacteraceae bacterium]|nr:hypothetical protein [Candidatus Peribacteraceae bacterium]